MLDIVGKRGWYFLFSGVLILAGLISMILPPGWSTLQSGLRPGIDFTSGSVMDVTFDRQVDQREVQARMDALGHPEALVQSTGSNSVIIRTKVLEEGSGDQASERQRVQDDLEENIAPITSVGFSSDLYLPLSPRSRCATPSSLCWRLRPLSCCTSGTPSGGRPGLTATASARCWR